ARGDDQRTVEPDRERKSVGAERTFMEDISDPAQMLDRVRDIAIHVAERLRRVESAGRTVTLKIKYHDFEISSRSRTVGHFVSSESELCAIAGQLLETPEPPPRPVRLLGVSVSNLVGPDTPGLQLPLPFQWELTGS
ncbi:MAG TPA: DNA polymerase IV, partial [Rhodothermales bacterium]